MCVFYAGACVYAWRGKTSGAAALNYLTARACVRVRVCVRARKCVHAHARLGAAAPCWQLVPQSSAPAAAAVKGRLGRIEQHACQDAQNYNGHAACVQGAVRLRRKLGEGDCQVRVSPPGGKTQMAWRAVRKRGCWKCGTLRQTKRMLWRGLRVREDAGSTPLCASLGFCAAARSCEGSSAGPSHHRPRERGRGLLRRRQLRLRGRARGGRANVDEGGAEWEQG